MEPIKISIVGDVMPSGVLFGQEGLFVSDDVLSELQESDLRVANLECAIGPYCDHPHFDKVKMSNLMDTVWAIDEDLVRVKNMGIEAVCLANNHIFDLDREGFKYTISELDKIGILYCGAGRNIDEASKPAVFTIKGKTVAILSFCDYREETVGYVPFATETEYGVNPLYPLEYSKSEISKYKKLYDYVIVVPHWGVEQTWVATKNVIKDSKELVKAGADAVVGGHTHRIQTPYKYKGVPIFPSLGNFFFPDRYLNKPRPTWYPQKGTDTSSYPSKYGYPWVEEPTLKLWRTDSRVGMIASLTLTDITDLRYKYVYLNEDNYLDLIDDLQKVLPKTDVLLLKLTYYMYVNQLCYLVVQFVLAIKHLTCRIINKLKRIIKSKK